MKKLLAVLAACTMVMSLTACGGNGSGTSNSEDKQTLVTVLTGDPASFHPDFKADDYSWPVNQNIFNRLVKLGPGNRINLDLAKSYDFSEDGLTLTFNLHENVKWHDGQAFSSADVKWTYDTLMAEQWSKSDNFTNVASIEAPDDNTVVFNLKTPDVSIVSKLSWYGTFIMPKHLYENTDQATNEYNFKPVGTGPYKLVEYQKGVQIKLERNDDFFGEKAKTKTLIYSIIPDTTTALQAFVNGEVDYFVEIPAANADDFDSNPDYTVYPELGINRSYLTFNLANENFSKPEVRQAIALGVDRQAIWDRTAGGKGQVAETFISPVFTDFADTTYKMPDRDIAKAQQLLEQAGYTKNAEGFYFSTKLTYFSDGSNKEVADIIKENLKEIGIKVESDMMEMAAWIEKVQQNSDFELTMLAGFQGPDVSGISGRLQSGSSMNIAKYNNPTMDALLAEGVTKTDVKERAAVYSEIQRIMSEDMPMVLLIDNGYKYPIKNTLQGTPQQVPELVASSEMTYTEFK